MLNIKEKQLKRALKRLGFSADLTPLQGMMAPQDNCQPLRDAIAELLVIRNEASVAAGLAMQAAQVNQALVVRCDQLVNVFEIALQACEMQNQPAP